jgi:hypothetical protein
MHDNSTNSGTGTVRVIKYEVAHTNIIRSYCHVMKRHSLDDVAVVITIIVNINNNRYTTETLVPIGMRNTY